LGKSGVADADRPRGLHRHRPGPVPAAPAAPPGPQPAGAPGEQLLARHSSARIVTGAPVQAGAPVASRPARADPQPRDALTLRSRPPEMSVTYSSPASSSPNELSDPSMWPTTVGSRNLSLVGSIAQIVPL